MSSQTKTPYANQRYAAKRIRDQRAENDRQSAVILKVREILKEVPMQIELSIKDGATIIAALEHWLDQIGEFDEGAQEYDLKAEIKNALDSSGDIFSDCEVSPMGSAEIKELRDRIYVRLLA